MNRELPDVQAGFRKGRGTRNQIANIHWIIEKARVPEKHLFLLYWLCQRLWLCGSQQIVENLQEMRLSDHLTCPLRNLYAGQEAAIRTEHGTTDFPKLGKDYVKAVYCHPTYFTYMQSTLCKMPDWMKHKLELRLPREIPITSDMQMTPHLWQKAKRN